MRAWFIMCACLVLMLATNAHAADVADADAIAGDAIVGEWFTDNEKSVIEVYKNGDKYCGKIIWLIEPNYPDGTDKVDSENPDESKRNRKIIGMDIVWGFENSGKDKWSNGSIYDPNNGKTYSCNAKLKGDKLKVRGFIGVSFLGRTVVWTRKR